MLKFKGIMVSKRKILLGHLSLSEFKFHAGTAGFTEQANQATYSPRSSCTLRDIL